MNTGAVISTLTTSDLVKLIGHDSWKGVSVAREKLLILAFGPVDGKELVQKIETVIPDAVTLDSEKDEVLPGGHSCKSLMLTFGPRKFTVDNDHTGTKNLFEGAVSHGHSFFLETTTVDGQPDLFQLKIGQSNVRQGITADSKVRSDKRNGENGYVKGMTYTVTRVS